MSKVIQADRDLLEAIYSGMFKFQPARERKALETIAAHRIAERDAVVAWLRTHHGDHARIFADAIERGDHLKEE